MASTELPSDLSLRLAGLAEESPVDGPGLRFTVFTQGCPHRCPGCHNPQTHDFDCGHWVQVEELARRMGENPLLQGLSLSGGEPFCQAAACARLARAAHAMGRDVWTWSGWTLGELREKARTEPAVARLLEETDVLVDGKYVEAQRDLDLDWRGSRNQRVIYLRREAAPS